MNPALSPGSKEPRLTPQQINLREVRRKNEWNQKFPSGELIQFDLGGQSFQDRPSGESFINGSGVAVVMMSKIGRALPLEVIRHPRRVHQETTTN